jgi:hypothetical protein
MPKRGNGFACRVCPRKALESNTTTTSSKVIVCAPGLAISPPRTGHARPSTPHRVGRALPAGLPFATGEEFRSAFARTMLARPMGPGGSFVIDNHDYQVRNSDGGLFGSWLEIPSHE